MCVYVAPLGTESTIHSVGVIFVVLNLLKLKLFWQKVKYTIH